MMLIGYLLLGVVLYIITGGLRQVTKRELAGLIIVAIFWPIFLGMAIISYVKER